MIILPPNIRYFSSLLAVSTTDKPVNRNINAHPLKQLNDFALRGFIFRDIHKQNKEGVREIRAIKYKNSVAGKYTRARAPLARNYTNRIFESKNGTSMKMVNYTERQFLFQ